MQGVLPQAGIAEILKAHFVGLASDCDAPEPQVIDLASTHLADAMMLPFLMITNADGEFLAGSHGSVNPNTLQATLGELTS